MIKTTLRTLILLLLIAALAGAAVAYSIVRRGLSTREEPSAAEVLIARTMRRLATPSAVRNERNPVPLTPAAVEAGLAHFADHCALCHANDGSGDTHMGRNLYPRAPDMRLEATQSLTDGELFSIIENGVRLTGMPAWGSGTGEGAELGWQLVHFIRHLPKLTPDEKSRMEALNPRTPEQFRQEEEERQFLEGKDSPAEAPREKPHGDKPHH